MTTKREETGKHDPQDCPPNCSLPYDANNCVYAAVSSIERCGRCGFNPEERKRRMEIPLERGADGLRYIHLPRVSLMDDEVTDEELEEAGELKPISSAQVTAKPKKKSAATGAAKPTAKAKAKPTANPKAKAKPSEQAAVAS